MSNFKSKTPPAIDLPQGWTLITQDFLAPFHEEELTFDEAIAYFDGLSPTWREAISNRIPRREIVREIEISLDEAKRVKRRQVTLLLGAGGEGKSTILRQVVSSLSKSGSFQNILWHDDVHTPLEKSFINDLIFTRETWLIVSDEADRITKDVFNSIGLLHEKAKNNVQFLLCCRDTDWKGENADELSWNEHALLVTKQIRGLTLEDANLIVAAWGNYGERGLGKLSEVDSFEAASRLVEQAKSEAQNNTSEGSFLGAMLRVRIGEAIQDHVKSLLRRLNDRDVPGGGQTLMDAFALIVALHAENILLLTKSVLARALGCPQEQLQRRVLGPLGEEAAVSEHAFYVLTRHRAIAETAKELLSKVFGVDFDGIYKTLLRSAREAFYAGELERGAKYWNLLPKTFFDRGREQLGIQLAKVLVVVEPTDPFPTASLAKLYRKARQPELAVETFRESVTKISTPDRGYYNEWATSEGHSSNHFAAVWLYGIALADGTGEARLDKERVPMSLSGIATAFGKLFDKTKDRRFIEACAAAAQLGLQSQPDERAESNLFSSKSKSSRYGVGDVSDMQAFEQVITGIHLAWELRPEKDDLPPSVKSPDELTFEKLKIWLGIKKQNEE